MRGEWLGGGGGGGDGGAGGGGQCLIVVAVLEVVVRGGEVVGLSGWHGDGGGVVRFEWFLWEVRPELGGTMGVSFDQGN